MFARRAGLLLLVSAAATIVMVLGRVLAEADQPTLVESLSAISDSRGAYLTSAIGRCVSAIALTAAAWLLLCTWIIRHRLGTPLVPILLGLSGMATTASGTLAIYLGVQVVPDPAGSTLAPVEVAYELRWILGKIGFSLAGAALAIAAVYQWRVGHVLRYISPASAVLGIAMQFIWMPLASPAHSAIGIGFLLWLVAVGTMLATGRVETYFSSAYQQPSEPVKGLSKSA